MRIDWRFWKTTSIVGVMPASAASPLNLVELAGDRCFAQLAVRPIAPTWAYRTIRSAHTALRRARAGFEVNFVVKGEPVAGAVGGKEVRCEAGDCLLIPPFCEHSLRYPQGTRLYHGRVELLQKGKPLRCHDAGLIARQAWPLLHVVQSLLAECQSATTSWREEKIKAWFWVLLCEMVGRQTPASAPAGRGLTPRQQLLIERALEDNMRPDVGALAGNLRLSPLYFRRQFKRTFGCSPREWIVRRRVYRAAALLSEGDRPAQEIAANLGYDDPRLFSRQFRHVMGVGPREFRREQIAGAQT